MIDTIPDDKLGRLHDLLEKWSEDQLTEKDLNEIKEAEKRVSSE